jgi:hypothetical protein
MLAVHLVRSTGPVAAKPQPPVLEGWSGRCTSLLSSPGGMLSPADQHSSVSLASVMGPPVCWAVHAACPAPSNQSTGHTCPFDEAVRGPQQIFTTIDLRGRTGWTPANTHVFCLVMRGQGMIYDSRWRVPPLHPLHMPAADASQRCGPHVTMPLSLPYVRFVGSTWPIVVAGL